MSMKCLVCGSPATNDRRGLCTLHYSRFNAAKRKLPAGERDAFEAELIDKKMLLPPKPRGRRFDHDVFAEIAKRRMDAHRRKTVGQKVDEEAREIVTAIASEAQTTIAKPNKPAAHTTRRKAGGS